MTLPTTCTLTVTGNELQILYRALDELPGKFSRELFAKLSGQVQAQINAAKSAAPPSPV